ncbi:MAG: DUF3037 domain-containing protein [Thaumarchaeota archaeon]|nr:DUF3037 domain-containing protein [Nitrososphaerota archaeon]
MLHGLYSVIQFVPQPERGEAINVGLVLVSDNGKQVWTHFRKASSFSRYPYHLRPNPEALKSFEFNLKKHPQVAEIEEPLSFLSTLHHDLRNSVQASEPHACAFADPKSFLDNLFRTIVVPP